MTDETSAYDVLLSLMVCAAQGLTGQQFLGTPEQIEDYMSTPGVLVCVSYAIRADS